MYQKICEECGQVFSSNRIHAKTCPSKCRSRTHSLLHRNKLEIKECKVCNKLFLIRGLNSSKTYCDKSCRDKNQCVKDFNSDERLKKNLRSRLYDAVKGKVKQGSAVKDLGCSVQRLIKHLESKFQSGMNWENYGLRGWHIDHVKPLSKFNLQNPEELLKAVHYSNLQPLWAKDNLSKGDKYDE